MRQVRPLSVLFLCLCVGAVSRPLFAQATGTIYGTVYDASGAAVPGAQITARNSGTNAIRSAQSDEQGQFVISLLPVGEYSVKIDHAGFTPFEQTSVLLASQHHSSGKRQPRREERLRASDTSPQARTWCRRTPPAWCRW